MIDYEVMKTETGYAMQVNGKLYAVPEKQRHLNKHKLLAAFSQGIFKPLEPEKPL